MIRFTQHVSNHVAQSARLLRISAVLEIGGEVHPSNLAVRLFCL
jgi:hypothetical protein